MPARLAARATFEVSASAARNAGIQTLGAGSAPARVAAPGAGMSLLIGHRSIVGGKAAAPPDSHYRDVPDMWRLCILQTHGASDMWHPWTSIRSQPQWGGSL